MESKQEMGTFVLLWIAQIVFGAIVFFTNPVRNDVSDKAQNVRKGAIYGGLIPCFGFMLVLQVIWLVIYRGTIARNASVRARLGANLQTDFGQSTDREQLPSQPAKPPLDNPFL